MVTFPFLGGMYDPEFTFYHEDMLHTSTTSYTEMELTTSIRPHGGNSTVAMDITLFHAMHSHLCRLNTPHAHCNWLLRLAVMSTCLVMFSCCPDSGVQDQ